MPISTGLASSHIRVGIILAEDQQHELTLRWESLLQENLDAKPDSRELRLHAEGDLLCYTVNGEEHRQSSITLSTTDSVDALETGKGIELETVRTGRGFHWQKQITIQLPGTLHFSARDGLILLVNELDVEAYVACVATSEMGAAAPAALLAAQTIVARCWALALVEKKHVAEGFDVCNDDCCQRYQGTTYLNPHSIKAARDTAGQVLVHENAVIDARYSKNCGGIAEDAQVIWGGEAVPYLPAFWDMPNAPDEVHYQDFDSYFENDRAFCAPSRFEGADLQAMLGKVDVSGSYYRWQVQVPKATIIANLKKYFGDDWQAVARVEVLARGASARISRLLLHGQTSAGQPATRELQGEYPVRQVFSESFLFSSAFEVTNSETLTTDETVNLRGCGWGHGVGLCQMGALGMALEGYSVPQILEHYYPGTTLKSLE